MMSFSPARGLTSASVPGDAEACVSRVSNAPDNSGSVSRYLASRSVRFVLHNVSRRTLIRGGLVSAITTLLVSVTASAAPAAPALRATASTPDYVTPHKLMDMYVSVVNNGADPLSGDLTVRYTFPAGIVPAEPFDESGRVSPICNTVGQVMECTADVTGIEPGVQIRLRLVTSVESEATGGPGEIEMSGGGTSDVFTYPFSVAVGPSGPFAIKNLNVGLSDGAVVPATRAGSDPSEIATTVKVLSEAQTNLDFPLPNLVVNAPTESFRDTVVHAPPGFVGNPTATPSRCTPSQLTSRDPNTVIPQCPPESQIGLVQINSGDIIPLYNVVPPAGSPAEFGFFYQSIVVTLLAKVRPSDYGIDIVSQKTPSSIPIPKFEVILWGNPTDKSHDRLRATCLEGGFGYNTSQGDCSLRTRSDVPFLRTPTSCPGTPLLWGIEMDTYQHVGTFVHSEATTLAMTGCEFNPFDPGFALAPSTRALHAASGIDAEVTMPQDASINGLAPADVRRVTVTLPAGLAINPSSADGLAACTDAQLLLRQEGTAACPAASKLGTVKVTTPLLDHEIGGTIFLRTQNSDDPLSGELFRIAVEIRSDDDGIDIKLPGSLSINPTTGQITTTFADLPQLPFEDFKLHFKQGARAPLVTPHRCGTYATQAVLESWGGKLVESTSSFDISSDGNGPPCGASQFAPSLMAGTNSPTAGAFTPFTLRLQRSDADEELGSLTSLSLPPGLLADVSSVPARCTEDQARAAACPAGSHIGTVLTGAGAGPDPFYVPGDVYLMGQQTGGAFKGDPFGLAVVVHVLAGPFDLGYVVVKAGIRINDDGSIMTRTEPFPRILDGVPLRLRDVRVNLDRPGFEVNPTNCNPMAVTGSVSSTTGQTAALSSRFQVGECAGLAFKPDFKVTTAGKTSKALGAGLRVHLATKEGPGGGHEANIAKVDVQLPAVLPARLTTLQKACTEHQFAANPAGCPEASFVGTVIAHTPILASPLSGPAILVSHGGQAFPDLVLVLQGEGVRLNITGHTQIKKGITYSHFDTVPDAPVSSFDLNLPQGPHSVLAANANLCAGAKTVMTKRRVTRRVHGHNRKVTVKATRTITASLLMPTTMTAQNGTVLKQTTKIAVAGCPGTKAAKKTSRSRTATRHREGRH
jgi:hypothetical protein